MGKKKQSFLDALIGSFKKSEKNDIDEFYNEEGNFEEFTPIKGSKKYKDQIVEENIQAKDIELNNDDNYFEEKPAKKTKFKKKVKTQNDFYSEESNLEEETTDGFEEIEDDDTLLGKIKKNLKMVILIAILIILLIVVLIVQSCTIKPGKLTGVNVNIPSVIYVDEQTEISATAIGKKNLSQTKYQFKVTNESIVEMEAKGQLTGRKVINKLIPLATGKFAISVSTKLEKQILKDIITDVTICKRLTDNALSTEDGIVIEMGSKDNRINLDVGSENACLEALDFKIEDTSIASIDKYGYFTPKKVGTTKITITDGTTTIIDDIHVKVKEDLTRVMGIKLDKDKTTINVGDTLQINATIIPDTATNKNIRWTSNNNGVVSVTNRGLIKGIGKGVAIITAETDDNKQQAIVIVTVVETPKPEPIDTTKPTCKMEVISKAENTAVIEITGYDDMSGIATLKINDNKLEIKGNKGQYTVNKNATYKGVVIDNAGNSNTCEIIVTSVATKFNNISINGTSDASFSPTRSYIKTGNSIDIPQKYWNSNSITFHVTINITQGDGGNGNDGDFAFYVNYVNKDGKSMNFIPWSKLYGLGTVVNKDYTFSIQNGIKSITLVTINNANARAYGTQPGTLTNIKVSGSY